MRHYHLTFVIAIVVFWQQFHHLIVTFNSSGVEVIAVVDAAAKGINVPDAFETFSVLPVANCYKIVSWLSADELNSATINFR